MSEKGGGQGRGWAGRQKEWVQEGGSLAGPRGPGSALSGPSTILDARAQEKSLVTPVPAWVRPLSHSRLRSRVGSGGCPGA